MISAADARKLTEDMTILQPALDAIEKAIVEAAQRGETQAAIVGEDFRVMYEAGIPGSPEMPPLGARVRPLLEKAGYTMKWQPVGKPFVSRRDGDKEIESATQFRWWFPVIFWDSAQN